MTPLRLGVSKDGYLVKIRETDGSSNEGIGTGCTGSLYLRTGSGSETGYLVSNFFLSFYAIQNNY